MITYFLIEENHITFQTTILKSCNKYDGLEIIQENAERFIKNRLGDIPIKYYLPTEHNRPFSYYIEKSRLNGLTIKNKYSNKGYFLNDTVHQKIISWYLAECIEEYESIWYYMDVTRFYLYDNNKWRPIYMNALDQLIKKVNKFEPELCQ